MDGDDEVTVFLEHGERRFYNAGCRCDECRDADRDYQHDTRRRDPLWAIRLTLESTPPPGPWIRNARCKTVPVSVFFPERGDSTDTAKQVCSMCPVLAECRAYALDAPQALQGVWGGLSAKARRDVKTGRRVA